MISLKFEAAMQVARLKQMTTTQLRARFEQIFDRAPATNNRSYLFKRLVLKVQEPGFAAALKERGKSSSETLSANPLKPIRDPRLPGVGSVLTRTYKGRELQVLVGQKGFTYEGEFFRSLSAIAQRVTGAHWNGFHFFGLIPSTQVTA